MNPMKSPRFRLLLLSLTLLGAGLGLTGCQTVQPWERELLADYTMRPDRDPLHETMSEHIYFSREASAGGKGVGASGCGCN